MFKKFLFAVLFLVLSWTNVYAQEKNYPEECSCSDGREPQICSVDNPSGCNNVVILTVEQGECTAKMPYCLLCVRRLYGESERTVSWELSKEDFEDGRYKFRAYNGVFINGMSEPYSEFNNQQPLEGQKRFSWTATSVRNTASLEHGADIKKVGSCKIEKSLIVNTDR